MKHELPRRSLLAAIVTLSLAALMVALAMPLNGGSVSERAASSPSIVLAAAPGKNEPVNAADIQWGPGPDFLPPGIQMVILDGNPAEAKQITLRLKIPAGYEFPAHWHPTQENVTVLSGTFYAGMGDKLDKSSGVALTPGGYMAIPATVHHYAWVEEEAVIQVDLVGPFAITYVDPTTDPRNQ